MKFVKKILSGCCFAALLSGPVQAIDLATAYQKATKYDSELATALASRNATAEGVTIARSGLLPNVVVGASATHTDIDHENTNSDSYITKGAAISITQPLLQMDVYHDFKASEFLGYQAEAEYVDAQQALLFRTGDAYFAVLRALDILKTTKQAEQAFKRQWEQAKERFDVGLIAITEVHESKAIYDSAKASRINALGDLDVSVVSLERITGQYSDNILTLSPDFPVTLDATKSLNDWVETALANNPVLRSAQFSVHSARRNVSAKKAGHYPTLEAEASYAYTDFDNLHPQNDTSKDATIALNFNLPLYTGGGTEASARQARYQLEQTQEVLNTTRRNIKVQIRSLYRTLRTNAEAVQARKQQTISNKSALEATRAGYEVGTRNIVDVLDAERLYFISLSDYSNAIYDYIINRLLFKQTAGVLSEQDIVELNRWLRTPAQLAEL